jgi:hypothetical protein
MNIPYLFGPQKHLRKTVIKEWESLSIPLTPISPVATPVGKYFPASPNVDKEQGQMMKSDNNYLYANLPSIHQFLLRSIFTILSSIMALPPLFACVTSRLIGGIDQQVIYLCV